MNDFGSDLIRGNGPIWVADSATSSLDGVNFTRSDIEHANRFKFGYNRDICLRGRARILNVVNSFYLPMANVCIGYRAHGQPYIIGANDIEISISHTASFVALALGRGRPVGVDIEVIDSNIDLIELAKNFFEPSETQGLRDLAFADRVVSFFHIWTMEEAALNALGTGLLSPLSRVRVPSISGPIRRGIVDIELEQDFAIDRQIFRAFNWGKVTGAAVGHVSDWRLFVVPSFRGPQITLPKRGDEVNAL